MDHVWLDHNVQREPDSVPYHDPGALLYTQRGGRDWITDTPVAVEKVLGTSDTSVIIQEYMFFGLLHEYCSLLGLIFHREQFIARKAGRLVLTTSNLHILAEDVLRLRSKQFDPNDAAPMQLVPSRSQDDENADHDWLFGPKVVEKPGPTSTKIQTISFFRELPAADRGKELYADIDDLLSSCAQTLSFLLKQQKSYQLNAVTLVAYCVLLESLVGLSEFVFGFSGAPGLRAEIDIYDELESLWISRCQASHICPERLYYLSLSDLPVTQAYIASSIMSAASGSHEECETRSRCRDRHIAVSLPLHHRGCDESCNQKNLATNDMSDLEARIRADGHALLQWKNEDLNDPDFSIHTSEESSEYVAFSHVWSHGLGNAAQNGLPSCQLLELKRIMDQAGCSSHAFWLDPICIPLNSSLKRRALEKMDAIYCQATKVIVIDRDVIRCKGNNTFRRIALLMSDWITRLWTFQEGFLPRDRLYIAFADEVMSLNDLMQDSIPRNPLSTQTLILKTSEAFRVTVKLAAHGMTFLNIVEAFQHRFTTNADDEFICFAILLGVDLRRLPDRPAMHDVVAHLPTVEQDVIFATGRRCAQEGFRWCPASVVTADSRAFFAENQLQGLLGPKGIRVNKAVLRLGTLDFRGLTPRHGSLEQQHLVLNCSDGGQKSVIVAACASNLGATAEQLRPRMLDDAALIFASRWSREDWPSWEAILVSQFGMRDGALCCHYECLVLAHDLDEFIEDNDMPTRDDTVMIDTVVLRDTEVWID